MPSTEELNRRHAAKMRARAEGTTEVKTYPAAPAGGTGGPMSELDRRYQEKLAARAAAAKPEPKAKAKADEKPEPKTEPKGHAKPEPDKGKPGR